MRDFIGQQLSLPGWLAPAVHSGLSLPAFDGEAAWSVANMATSSLQKISRQGSVDSAPMLRRRAQRMMPVRLRVVRTVFANQLLPSLREKPLACGSSTVNRMHECEIARTSQLFYLNFTSRFDEKIGSPSIRPIDLGETKRL
jgi:hypothetical protein